MKNKNLGNTYVQEFFLRFNENNRKALRIESKMKSFGTKIANGILMRVKAVAFIICDWLMPFTFNESLSCSIFICFSCTRTFYWDQIMTTFTLWQSNRCAIELIEVTYAKTFIIKMLLLTLEHFFLSPFFFCSILEFP